MVWEQLKEELIFPKLEASNSKEVFEKVGGKFIEEGFCKDSYVDALVNRESEFPTGIDVDGFGIAIPHTDISHVNKAGIAIATLENPVKFVQMGTDDEEVEAKVIFMLAVDDPKKHLELLQNVLAVLQDKDVLNKLSNADKCSEIINIVKEKEKCIMANTEKKVTRKEMLEAIKEVVLAAAAYDEQEAQVEFIDKEIAATIKKAEKARERAEKAKAIGDDLRNAIEAVLTSERQTADKITEIIQEQDAFKDVTKAKVVARLSQLVRAEKATKEEVKVGSRRLMGYAIAEVETDEVAE